MVAAAMFGCPPGITDVAERLRKHVPDMKPDIPVPHRHDDRLVGDAVHEGSIDAFKIDQEVCCLGKGIAVSYVSDI